MFADVIGKYFCARLVECSLLIVAASVACSDDAPLTPSPPTYKAAIDAYPAWSADGEYIAYRRLIFSAQGPPGVYLIKPDGTGNRLLLDETPFYGNGFVLLQEIRFSPDGRQISITKDLEVFLLDVESGSLRQLTNTGQNAAHPDWSPDGRSMVYRRAFFRSADLDSSGFYIVDVPSGKERPLFNDGERLSGGDLRWAPQGETIAFAATQQGGYPDIYIIRSDGTGYRRLTIGNNHSYADIPCWIDGGSRVLYAWHALGGAGGYQTRVMNSDGTEQTTWPLTLDPLTLLSDAISPDSRRVVLPGLPPGSDSLAVLFIQNLDDYQGTTLRQLTSFP